MEYVTIDLATIPLADTQELDFAAQDDSDVVRKRVLAVSEGTHNNFGFSADQIERMVTQVNLSSGDNATATRVPVTVGHTDDPSRKIGYIYNLTFDRDMKAAIADVELWKETELQRDILSMMKRDPKNTFFSVRVTGKVNPDRTIQDLNLIHLANVLQPADSNARLLPDPIILNNNNNSDKIDAVTGNNTDLGLIDEIKEEIKNEIKEEVKNEIKGEIKKELLGKDDTGETDDIESTDGLGDATAGIGDTTNISSSDIGDGIADIGNVGEESSGLDDELDDESDDDLDGDWDSDLKTLDKPDDVSDDDLGDELGDESGDVLEDDTSPDDGLDDDLDTDSSGDDDLDDSEDDGLDSLSDEDDSLMGDESDQDDLDEGDSDEFGEDDNTPSWGQDDTEEDDSFGDEEDSFGEDDTEEEEEDGWDTGDPDSDEWDDEDYFDKEESDEDNEDDFGNEIEQDTDDSDEFGDEDPNEEGNSDDDDLNDILSAFGDEEEDGSNEEANGLNPDDLTEDSSEDEIDERIEKIKNEREPSTDEETKIDWELVRVLQSIKNRLARNKQRYDPRDGEATFRKDIQFNKDIYNNIYIDFNMLDDKEASISLQDIVDLQRSNDEKDALLIESNQALKSLLDFCQDLMEKNEEEHLRGEMIAHIRNIDNSVNEDLLRSFDLEQLVGFYDYMIAEIETEEASAQQAPVTDTRSEYRLDMQQRQPPVQVSEQELPRQIPPAPIHQGRHTISLSKNSIPVDDKAMEEALKIFGPVGPSREVPRGGI